MPGVPEPLAGQVTVAVRFAWVGDPDAGRAALAPLLAEATPVLGGVDVMPYAAVGMIHNDPVDPMPTHEGATLLRDLPAEAVDTLLALAGPQAPSPQVIVELRHLGGAIARRPEHASAFSYRDAAYSLMTIGIAAPPVVAATAADAAAALRRHAAVVDRAVPAELRLQRRPGAGAPASTTPRRWPGWPAWSAPTTRTACCRPARRSGPRPTYTDRRAAPGRVPAGGGRHVMHYRLLGPIPTRWPTRCWAGRSSTPASHTGARSRCGCSIASSRRRTGRPGWTRFCGTGC